MTVYRLGAAISSVTIAMLFVLPARAAFVTVDFTGTVIEATGQPGVNVGNQIVGAYSFDPAVVNVGTSASALYDQPAVATYQLSVGSFSFSSTLTRIEIDNEDFAGYDRFLASHFENFGINSELDSSVYLYTPSPTSLMSTALLPTPPDFTSFTYAYIDYRIFDPIPNVTTFIRADITSLAAVPEPGSLFLFLTALIGLGVMKRWRVRPRAFGKLTEPFALSAFGDCERLRPRETTDDANGCVSGSRKEGKFRFISGAKRFMDGSSLKIYSTPAWPSYATSTPTPMNWRA